MRHSSRYNAGNMFSDPEQNIAQFGLTDHMTVADLGAGTGGYTLAAARRLREYGHVHAVEVQKELLSRIENTAREERLGNVEVLWGDCERYGAAKLANDSVDAVIVANVLFQVEDPEGLVDEVKRILKPGGSVLVVDWKDSFGGVGPAPDAIVSQKDARVLFEQSGFQFVKSIDAGEHHYGFVVSYE